MLGGDQNKSVTLKYIRSIEFDYDENLGLLKCKYSYNYNDEKDFKDVKTYTFVLSRHT